VKLIEMSDTLHPDAISCSGTSLNNVTDAVFALQINTVFDMIDPHSKLNIHWIRIFVLITVV